MKHFLWVLLLAAGLAYGAEDVQSDSKTGDDVEAGAVLEVSGNRYSSSDAQPVLALRSYWTENAFGIVRLGCPGAYTASSALTGTAEVNLSITYEVEENGLFVTKTLGKVLTIEFSNGYAHDMDFVRLEGAQHVRAEVETSGNTFPSGWPDLELTVEVHTSSYEWMTADAISSLTLSHAPSLTTDGNLSISWTALSAAEAYELEWTYVSDQSADPAVRLEADEVEIDRFLFRNNSSRVVVSGLSYQIPMIYEKGFILYRLRAVGKNVANGLTTIAKSKWTAPDIEYGLVSDFPEEHVFVYDGLEQNLNWQSSLSFAEEGKHKVVLSYHDGSSRNRQAVTRINSDQRSVVGETFYDYNGRPALQVLPVPVIENSLTYFPAFNLIEGSEQMDKADYDQAVEGNACSVVAPPFDTTAGASSYYSGGNAFDEGESNTGSDLLNRSLIPNAEKYPYTQTRYTPDNTGRIREQSGVGPTYKLGQHSTRYLYGIPYQAELTRLFGPQVGYAGHYKKNTVVDPNGQTSVSYLDLDGKVVATALAGEAPDGLDELDADMERTISSDVLKDDAFSNVWSADRLSKTYSSRFTVAPPAKTYTFTYEGLIGSDSIQCELSEDPFNFIMNGAVDLEIRLDKTCGEPVFVHTDSTSSGTGGGVQELEMTENPSLTEGEYQLTKTLRINETKLENYWQSYLQQDSICILTQSVFIEEELAKMNLLGCGMTCEQCITERDSLLALPGFTAAELESIASACDELCDPSIGCRASLEMLRGDFSPGGQYGKLRKDKVNLTNSFNIPVLDADGNPLPPDIGMLVGNTSDENLFDPGDPDGNPIVAEQFPMSIYNPANGLRFPKYLDALPVPEKVSWRYPILVQKSGYTAENRNNQILFSNEDLTGGVSYDTTSYTDVNGDVFYVSVYRKIVNGAYAYEPEVSDTNRLITEDAEANLFKVKAQYLAKLEDFERYWQPHWANFLVPYHPEFPYLLDCTGDLDELAFDYSLLNAATVEQAVAAGFLSEEGDPLFVGDDWESTMDPYLDSSEANYDYIKKKYDEFVKTTVGETEVTYNMAEAATIAIGCPQGIEECGLPGCLDGDIDTDAEWTTLRSFYIAEKQKLIRQQKLHKAVDGEYYNGCIGQPNIFAIPDAEYFRNPITYTEVRNSRFRFCGWVWRNGPYREKEYVCNDPLEVRIERTTYPYLNPDQLCYINETHKYEGFQQRFYPNLPAANGAGQVAYRCSSYIPGENPGDSILVPVPCEEDIEEAAEATFIEAQRYKYEQCGLCPMAQDVELLIRELKTEGLLKDTSGVLISCGADTLDVHLGTTLYPALLLLNSNEPDVYWTSALSSGDKILTGQLISNSSTIATLTLEIPSGVPVTFADLRTPCCFNVSSSDNNEFTMRSSFVNDSLEEEYFTLYGSFTLDLAPCFVPPRCQTTTDVPRIIFFLNTLVMGGSDFEYKEPNLDTSGDTLNLLDVGVTNPSLKLDVPEYYNPSVRSLLKKDDRGVYGGYVDDMSVYAPQWTSTITSNVLSGQLLYVEAGDTHSVFIEISNLPAAVGDIKEFLNMRPVPVPPDPMDVCDGSCQKQVFRADVRVENGSGRSFHSVDIYVPTMLPVICVPAVPASN